MQIILQANNGQFVSAEGGGGGAVNANRLVPAAWESFTLLSTAGKNFDVAPAANGDRVHLQTVDGAHFLCAENGGGGALNATRTAAQDWETFTIVFQGGTNAFVDGAQIALQTSRGYFVCADNGGGSTTNANRARAAGWETFTVWISYGFVEFSFGTQGDDLRADSILTAGFIAQDQVNPAPGFAPVPFETLTLKAEGVGPWVDKSVNPVWLPLNPSVSKPRVAKILLTVFNVGTGVFEGSDEWNCGSLSVLFYNETNGQITSQSWYYQGAGSPLWDAGANGAIDPTYAITANR